MSKVLPTILGFVAIVLWGTTIPLSRHAAEQLGAFSSATAVYLVSGAIGCLYLLITGRLRTRRLEMPRKYLWGCGGLMVAYSVLLYAAIGFARDGSELIMVTVANYLWPALTLILSIPILGHRARGGILAAAVLLCTAGQWLAFSSGVSGSLRGLSAPVIAALAAAIAWGLYSNLSRRWAAGTASTAMPLFILATGMCLLLLRCLVREENTWTPLAMLEIAYLAVFPTLSAYTCWDIAMRRGNLVLVAAASYLTPVLSVWVSSWYLSISVTPAQWLATGMVVLGAVACKWSLGPPSSGPVAPASHRLS
jgi:drug/metabolite transporter (DMT)-like permease